MRRRSKDGSIGHFMKTLAGPSAPEAPTFAMSPGPEMVVAPEAPAFAVSPGPEMVVVPEAPTFAMSP